MEKEGRFPLFFLYMLYICKLSGKCFLYTYSNIKVNLNIMKRILLFVSALWMGTMSLFATDTTCFPHRLLCDYLENPLGIDNPNPRLSWQLNDSRQGAKQTAYQIWVGTDSLEVVNEKGNQWNSG